MTVLSLYCRTLLLLAVMASLVPVLDGAASFLIVEIEDTTHTTHARKDTTHARKDTTHARKETTHARKETTHARKDTTHARKDTTNSRKDTTHARKDTTLARKDTTLARKDTTHVRKDTTHARKDTTHARKDTTHPRKETTPIRRSTNKGKYFKPTVASFLPNTLCFCRINVENYKDVSPRGILRLYIVNPRNSAWFWVENCPK